MGPDFPSYIPKLPNELTEPQLPSTSRLNSLVVTVLELLPLLREDPIKQELPSDPVLLMEEVSD